MITCIAANGAFRHGVEWQVSLDVLAEMTASTMGNL